jgi:broad specificity phosphatase PhoE
VDASLVEADVGLWTDLSWPEIEQAWPAEYRAFREDAERHGYHGGENLAQVRARALATVQDLVARHPAETIIAVSHGVLNRVLLAHWIGLPLRYARQIPQDNAAYNTVEFHSGEVRVRTVNATGYPVEVSGRAA